MRATKDSGVEWIGEIPDKWTISKIKRFYFVINGSTPKSDKLEFWDGNIVWITPTDMSKGIVELSTSIRTITEEGLNSCGTFLIPINSIILSTRAPIGQLCLVGRELCTNQGCKSLVMKFDSNHKFHYYYLLTQKDTLNMFGRGTTFLELSTFDLANFSIPIPPLPEQTRIASFLDNKCANIDSAIENQRATIDKLKEYRQAVITEAVTKGLNPDVPMKDSGVEWIGDIPEGWNVSRVRNEFSNLDGRRKPISAEDRGSGDDKYDYYGASGVIGKINDYIFDETLLLIGEDGANLVMRNLPLIYIATGKYWVNNHAHILKPLPHNDLFYFAYQLESVDLFNYITGSTQPKLTQWNLSVIPVVVPDINEQQEIAAYLDSQCTAIDSAVSKKETLIEKLTEYKKSLIYEAVTGKIEVPELSV